MVFKHTQQLRTITPDEFLPPISRWSTWGGLALLGVFGGAIALSALFKYNVTVKASAVIRPEGGLRIVEATAAGQVQQILVEPNDDVQQGETLVILDDAELRSRQQQIQTEIEQIQQQRSHIQQELIALDNQIAAEQQAGERAIAAAQAELEQRRQAYLDAQTTTAADVREAEAAVQFAQEELSRYQQLAGTGALADLQLQEKVAALETTQARLEKARGLSNPSHAAVSQAQENRQQTRAQFQANLSSLGQAQSALRRQQLELLKEQQTQQQALEQVDLELKTLTIRAPLAGTIQSISLRNPNQVLEAGEGIAQIAPNTDDLIIARVSTDSAGEKTAADDKFVSSLEAMLFFIKKHNPFSPEIH
jgi:HlyD family secretion protein